MSGRSTSSPGPVADLAEVAAEISEATGREIEYVPISIEQFAAEAAGQGVPAEVIELLTYVMGEVLDGRKLGHG